MGKRKKVNLFKQLKQLWNDWCLSLKLRRCNGVITNASEEDIASSSFKSSEEAIEFLKNEFQSCNDKHEQSQQLSEENSFSVEVEENIEVIEPEVVGAEEFILMPTDDTSKIGVDFLKIELQKWNDDEEQSLQLSEEQSSSTEIEEVIEVAEAELAEFEDVVEVVEAEVVKAEESIQLWPYADYKFNTSRVYWCD